MVKRHGMASSCSLHAMAKFVWHFLVFVFCTVRCVMPVFVLLFCAILRTERCAMQVAWPYGYLLL